LGSYLELYLWSPYQLLLTPVVWRIMIWGDGLRTMIGGF
jgi:hypothetical protein